MPFYHRLGRIPHKRHTQFKKPDGKLYREELMGLEGFSSIQSLLYHQFLPPRGQQDRGPGLTQARAGGFRSHPAPGLQDRRGAGWEATRFRRGFRC